MDDVDVAVPLGHATAAIALLREEGLQPERRLTPDVVAVSHAETFTDGDDRTVDLHWDLLRWSGRDEPFWEDAVPVDLRGVATRAPSATDQILLVAAHGAYWNAVHPMRWVADLHVLLRSPIDWPRLEGLAVERELTAPLAHALAYVGDRFAAPVPEGFAARLAARHPRPLRRVAHRVSALPPSPRRSAGLLAVYVDAYVSRARQRGHRPTPRGFLRFLQHHLEVDDRRQLVARMGRGARRNAGLAPAAIDARTLFGEG